MAVPGAMAGMEVPVSASCSATGADGARAGLEAAPEDGEAPAAAADDMHGVMLVAT